MNTYGQHTDLVQEVADFGCSDKVLNNPTPFDDGTVIIERDFETALHRARTQGQDEDEEMDEDWLSWGDIREHELSELYILAPEASHDKEINNALHQLTETMRQCLEENLPQEYIRTLNGIDGDMYSCARSRALMGDQNPFFEKLFNLYKAGVWPCGWEGNYPEGQLVVFVPSS